MKELYIGIMSGTSLDGTDVAIVDFSKQAPRLVSSFFQPYPAKLLARLNAICRHSDVNLDELGQLDATLGLFYAQCVLQTLTLAKLQADDIIAIGSHGQTIQHSPNVPQAFTLQIGDANRVAEKTGISVVADFRRRDMAAGGQGAPLVPAFHQAMFQSSSEDLAIINIGGISNITVLPANSHTPIIGFDCGPGNTLIDQWCQHHLGINYDEDGHIAKHGHVNQPLLNSLLSDPYFKREHPKSTGPEYFNLTWLNKHLQHYPTSINDVVTTLCELTAMCIAESLTAFPHTDSALLCGGGVNNLFMQSRITALAGCPVSTTDNHGVKPDWLEAIAFAWLAKQTIEGKPGNITSVTGADKPVILGAIYPANLSS